MRTIGTYGVADIARIGRVIRESRVSQQVSQRELAIKCGFSPAYMCRVEKGDVDCPPRPEFLIAVANALGLSVVTLLTMSKRNDCAAIVTEMARSQKEGAVENGS